MVLLAGVLAFGGAALSGRAAGIPQPKYHDEFSYLLAADTFARGRLTNPPHPMWQHFESMHIIQQPTYASKYPPAQGLVLAAGQVVGGHPVWGVWLSVGLMCAAICWMLYAWLPPWWALAGTAVAVLRFGVAGYWAQSYWGGAVAAMGGALVFGAVRRLMVAPSGRDAAVLGAGMAILANSRPYEGLVTCLPVSAALAIWALKQTAPARRATAAKVLVPLGLVLGLTAAFMARYNHAVTGSAFRMPYQVHEETYRVEPVFLWKAPRPEPAYRHAALREFHAGFELNLYKNQFPIGRYGFRSIKGGQLTTLWQFYLGPLLTLPLLMLPWMWKDPWIRLALAACGALALGLLLETWILPHYAAPIAAVLVALPVLSIERLHRDFPRIARLTMGVLVVTSAVSIATRLGEGLHEPEERDWHQHRAKVAAELGRQDGQHLVIVRYGARHSVQNEWVYNAADIDNAKIVWARAMDESANRRLVDYFSTRQAWLLSIDEDADLPSLVPWPAAASR